MKGIDRLPATCGAPLRALVLCGLSALAACGGGYGGGGGQGKPTVTLSAAPTTITLGQSATLTWTSSLGATCTAGGGWGGSKSVSGNEVVTPAVTGGATFMLTCTGGTYRGTATDSATITVNAPSAYTATRLVTDAVGTGAVSTDANLVNAWGIVFGTTSPAWVTNNHTGTATVYDGNGKSQPHATPLVLHLPHSAGGADFDPAGIVFNGSNDFVVSAGDRAASARFIFDGEAGMIAGWSPAVDFGIPVVMYADAGGAVYKGLAIANNGTGNFLYAADFRHHKVDVFDAAYHKQAPTATSFAFVDPTLPAGYAPFGIQAIANGPGGAARIYVTYAKQTPPENLEEATGPGLGLVNVFDANGNLVKHLVVEGGQLNAPWGLALAPADAGTLSNALLVGNFGDGRIHGYDPASGAFLGTVLDAAGEPIAVPGLWGIAFGNGTNNQPRNTLFYAAGTNDEANGELGRIDLGATAPVLNAPPVVEVTAPGGTVHGTIELTATATASVNVAKVEFLLNGAVSLGTATVAPYSVAWDTTTVTDGVRELSAQATDVDGNVGTSEVVTVTVANAAVAATR
ncbi:MAG TPA: TIGR03118 family protein, partial [Steroidobacteraceae bacterium]